MANAYLLTGRANKDKELLANQLASYLNCTNKEKQAGASCLARTITSYQPACQNCRWIASFEHPQAWLTLTGSDTKTGKIPVEKARLLQEELSKTSSYFRMVVIPEAQEEILHRPAANALLKTIEEPGTNIVFMFFAPSPADVLPTIVSRCQTIPLPMQMPLDFWFAGERSTTCPWQEEYKAQVKVIQSLASTLLSLPSTQTSSSNLISVLKLTEQLTELKDNDLSFNLIVDLLAYTIIASLRSRAIKEAKITRHLNQVLSLAEKCKYEMEHFVTPKTAIESMVLSLTSLKGCFEGELTIGHC